MSQGSQELFPRSGLILPLSKFSYATTHGESTNQIPWIHLGKNHHHLTAIFENKWVEDGMGQGRTARKFKVIQDPEVLEDIDIDILATEANRAKAVGQDPRINGKVPNVAVIVKNPCVAIRYPLAGEQIRRIQLRLANNDDYYDILKILTRANVPFSEAPSTPIQPLQHFAGPFSSSSSLLRPCDSVSQIGARPAPALSNTRSMSNSAPAVSASWESADALRPTSTSGSTYESYYGVPSNEIIQQSSGLTPNHTLAFHENPASTTQRNETVSSYFANPSHSDSVQNAPKSTLGFVSGHAAINLYQPRPSTAPAADSQSLTQMLPPKRQLPFKTSHPTKKSKKGDTGGGKSVADSGAKPSILSQPPLQPPKDLSLDIEMSVENASQISTKSAKTESSPKQKYTAPSKTSKPRLQKKQPVKGSAKKSTKDSGKDDTIPSVGQLLEGTQKPLDKSPEGNSNLDTQALLSRAESTRPHQNLDLLIMPYKPASRPGTASSSSQTRKCRTCTLRKGKCDGNEPCDWCREFNMECTYTAPVEREPEIQVPSSQPEADAVLPMRSTAAAAERAKQFSTEAGPKANNLDTEAEEPSPKRQEQPTDSHETNHSHTSSTDPNNSTTLACSSTTTTDLHLSPALVALYCSPGFSPTDNQQLTSWAGLSELEQRRSLNTWICLQLRHPGFAKLLKRMDESWQANLLA